MKKVLKITGKVLLAVLIILVLFLAGVFIFNKIMLSKEKSLLQNQQFGQLVEVDGHNMSISVSGEGEHTLVFMAGSGASAPIIDYTPFAGRFDDDYKCVIIEKFGYGFSDVYDGARDVETRVIQNRNALKAAGVNAPYILCPHSYSGLEAIYWAQNYPDEIEAIIGLDMAVPRSYDSYDEGLIKSVVSSDSFKRTIRDMGLLRLFVGNTIPKDFTEETRQLITALMCRTYGNQTASNEVDSIISDIKVIDSKNAPDVPTLLIISDGTITDGWIGFEMDYAASISEVTTVQLDCGHYVHKHEPEQCEKSMREFIAGLETD